MTQTFYIRSTNMTRSGTWPSTEQSAWTPSQTVLATKKALSASVGPAVISATATTTADQNAQTILFGWWFSEPLAAQTIPTGAWTLNFAALEGNAASNLHFSFNVYIWRPSNGTKVGTISDCATYPTNPSSAEPGTSATILSATFTTTSTLDIQDGDVLVIEVWRDTTTQSMSTAYANSFRYDGTSSTATDYYSNLHAPADLTLLPAYLRQLDWRGGDDKYALNATDNGYGNDAGWWWFPDIPFRIRIGAEDTANGQVGAIETLQYRLNGGTWTDVTTTSSVVKAVNSAQFTDGANTTQTYVTSGNSHTFIAGKGSTTGSFSSVYLQYRCTEVECSLQIIDADTVPGDVIEFRLKNMNEYPVELPKVTVAVTAAYPDLTNTCEGPNNTTVTATNGDGPDDWSSVFIGQNCILAYDNSVKHYGSTSMKATGVTGSGGAYTQWTISATEVHIREYMYFNTEPNNYNNIMTCGSDTTDIGVILCDDATPMDIQVDSGQSAYQDLVLGADLTTGMWVRLELDVKLLTGTDWQISARAYYGANLDTMQPSRSTTGVKKSTGKSSITRARFAIPMSQGATWTCHVDDIALDTTAIPEPPPEGPQEITAVVTMTGGNTLSSTPILKIPATVAITGANTLSSTAAIQVSATAVLSGSNTLGITPAAGRVAAVTLSGMNTLTVAPILRVLATVTLTGANTLTVTPILEHPAAITLVGGNTLTVSPIVRVLTTVVITGSNSLSSGTLVGVSAVVAIAGTNTLTVTGIQRVLAVVAFTGTNTVVINVSATISAEVVIAGGNTLTTSVIVVEVVVAVIAGANTLTVAPILERPSAVTLVGANTLTTVAQVAIGATVVLIGSNTVVIASTLEQVLATIIIASTSTLTTAPYVRKLASVTLTGTNVLIIQAGGVNASVLLVGSNVLTIAGYVVRPATILIVGQNTLSPVVLDLISAVVNIVNSSALTVSPSLRQMATAIFMGTNELLVELRNFAGWGIPIK